MCYRTPRKYKHIFFRVISNIGNKKQNILNVWKFQRHISSFVTKFLKLAKVSKKLGDKRVKKKVKKVPYIHSCFNIHVCQYHYCSVLFRLITIQPFITTIIIEAHINLVLRQTRKARNFAYIRLPNKPYENEVTLTKQKPPLKYCQFLELLIQLKRGLDL